MIDENGADAPADVQRWLREHRQRIEDYLRDEGVPHGPIASEPGWDILPHVSIWAVAQSGRPERVAFWAICGDVPTDYLAAEGIASPREAMREIATRWREVAGCMAAGKSHPTIEIGSPENWPALAPQLAGRAETLLEWADDESLWTQ